MLLVDILPFNLPSVPQLVARELVVARFITLSDEEIFEVAACFGITARSHHPLGGGCENTSVLLKSDTGDWVLTAFERRDRAEILLYAAYWRGLHDAGMPVPALRPRTDGGYVVDVQGRPALLAQFVRGVRGDEHADFPLEDLGRALGGLHTSDVACALQPRVRLAPRALKRALNLDDREFGAWILRTHGRVAHVVADPVGRVATHCDLFPDNLICTADGVVIIDWEDGAYDTPLLDLGSAVLGLCCEEGVFMPDRLNRLLQAYRQATGGGVDCAALLDATTYFCVVTAFNRYQARDSQVADVRSYAEIPATVDSIASRWLEIS